jgi:hypothetical protein
MVLVTCEPVAVLVERDVTEDNEVVDVDVGVPEQLLTTIDKRKRQHNTNRFLRYPTIMMFPFITDLSPFLLGADR